MNRYSAPSRLCGKKIQKSLSQNSKENGTQIFMIVKILNYILRTDAETSSA